MADIGVTIFIVRHSSSLYLLDHQAGTASKTTGGGDIARDHDSLQEIVCAAWLIVLAG